MYQTTDTSARSLQMDAVTLMSGTPLQEDASTDWVRVLRAKERPEYNWRPSGSSVHLYAASTTYGEVSAQASIPLSPAPCRSSIVHEDFTRIIRTSYVPQKVLCVLVVSLKEDLHVCQIPLYLDDRDEHTFDDQIMRRIKCYVQSQGSADRTTYIRAGQVRLLALSEDDFVEMATWSVENSREWDRHVTKMVADYCNKDEDHEEPVPFMLEVGIEYEWLAIDKTRGPLSPGISGVLFEHRLTNMHGEEFWSKKLLKALFTRNIVNELLTEDDTWKKELVIQGITEEKIKHEQNAFLDYIMPDRIRLLAAMMRTRVSIGCLYRLWKSGYRKYDNDPLDSHTFGRELGPWEAGDLCKHMASFNPVTFTRPNDKREPLRHKRIGTGKVVPVLYDNLDGQSNEIGRGSFGTVYRVRVQGDYHAFSANKDECYALKCLNRKLESTSEIEGEAGVLEMLALRPHDHITPLYASWTREGLTYILLPKADMSLHQFLNNQPTPDLTDQSKVIWFFTQLRGLAAAVEHIHHIGFNETSSTSAAAMEARKRKLHMGYHHDLKPGNVLVFDDCLKISDFGAAKIHQLVSGKSTVNTPYTNNSPYGDETYGGPDRLVTTPSTVGQPYDIWSLGCIFMEIFLWAVGDGKRLKTFAIERRDGKPSKCHKQCNGPQSHDGAAAVMQNKTKNEESTTEDEDGAVQNDMATGSYWYQCDKGGCHLKPCVETWLKELKTKHCIGNDLFHRLYQEIRKMLRIKPSDRVTAGVVKDNIGSLRYQAEVNFTRHDHKDFGCEIHIGDVESDNTTYVETVSNYIPTPYNGNQRSRGNTLEPPSPQRSPTGRISSEEVLRDAGSSFELSILDRALEDNTDTDARTPRQSSRRRSSTRSSCKKQPALFLTNPDGRAKAIENVDDTPRNSRRRWGRSKSLDMSSLSKSTEISHTDISHATLRFTKSDIPQRFLDIDRNFCDTPQESRTPQKTEVEPADLSVNNGDDDHEISSVTSHHHTLLSIHSRSEQTTSTEYELYWRLCGEAIRQLDPTDGKGDDTTSRKQQE